MTSTAAVTIAVAAAATATSIAVGPRVGLLRRRLATCWRTPSLQVLKPLGCCISSGPRAAPALSTHASGGVAPAGHLSLSLPLCPQANSANINARIRKAQLQCRYAAHNYCNDLPRIDWRATHIRPLVCVWTSATARAVLAPAGCNNVRC